MQKLGLKAPGRLAVFIVTVALLIVLQAEVEQAAILPENNASVSGPVIPDHYTAGITVTGLDNDRTELTNRVDGYSIILPQEMKVVDTSSTGIRTVLEDKHRRLEIYKQPLLGISASQYISYSNRFLENTIDHRPEFRQTLQVGGYPAEITQWSRERLAKVADDKNHYACIDIITNEDVYTFFVKSDVPFYETGGYMELVNGFSTFLPSAPPASLILKPTDNFFNPETKGLYEQYFSADSNLTWGIFEYSAPQDFAILDGLEKKLDYQFKFLLVYKHIQKEYPIAYVKNTLRNAYNRDRIVELTLQPAAQDAGEGNMVYDILQGKYDAFLESFAAETAEFGHPVLFRFGNEMNGDWCEYSGYHTSRDPQLFKELYKYIHAIFREAEADNVIWVWNPNERSFPSFKWNNEQMYYPGDEYVDIVGLTGYNTGTYYSGETWRGFAEIYGPLYQRMALICGKPLMITEFSSSSVGGDKEQWVRAMLASIHQYPRIKAAIWWNGCDWDKDGNVARPYFIGETEELLMIFREYFQHCHG